MVRQPEEGQKGMAAFTRVHYGGGGGKHRTYNKCSLHIPVRGNALYAQSCQQWPLKVEFAHLEHELNSLTLPKIACHVPLQGSVTKCSQVTEHRTQSTLRGEKQEAGGRVGSLKVLQESAPSGPCDTSEPPTPYLVPQPPPRLFILDVS